MPTINQLVKRGREQQRANQARPAHVANETSMPRKGEVKRREVLSDPKFHDRTVTKFINSMMHDGKKSLTERILYQALDLVGERAKEDALGVFKRALDQVKPLV